MILTKKQRCFDIKSPDPGISNSQEIFKDDAQYTV